MSTDKFLDLQDGFYNALSQGLGFPPGSPFQLFQPSPPLVAGPKADQALWAYFNNIPPYSLTQNYVASGGNQFFSNYKALLSALQGTPSTFQLDVGPDCYAEWLAYIKQIAPIPSPSQLPQLFFNWASVFYPSVANVGASDLAQQALDPITSAQTEITWLYSGKAPDWSLGYAELKQQLSQAPSRAFNMSSSSMNTDVSQTWSKGSNSGFFGLWGGSSYKSTYSSKFASSEIQLYAQFDHVMPFQAAPGQWYSSAAMGDAYSHQSGPPWNPKSTISWENTFDAQNGNMSRFAVNLIVVDTMYVSVDSRAEFSTEERENIQNNKGAGMWPFYSSGGSSGSSTRVDFDEKGRMTVIITSEPNVPVVIGCNVIPVNEFVGHSTETARFMRSALNHLKAAA